MYMYSIVPCLSRKFLPIHEMIRSSALSYPGEAEKLTKSPTKK